MYSAKSKKWALNHVINSREQHKAIDTYWKRKKTDPFERIFLLSFGSIKVAAHARVRYSGPSQTELYFHALSSGLEESEFMSTGFAKYMLGHQKMPTYKQVKDFFIAEAKAERFDLEKPIAPRQTSIFDFVA